MSATKVLLAARPESGFRFFGWAHGSFEGWVVRNLHHHMRGALGNGQLPPYEWLSHDEPVVSALAVALGKKDLVNIAQKMETEGDLVMAARTQWCISLLHEVGKLSGKEATDHTYHAADLLHALHR